MKIAAKLCRVSFSSGIFKNNAVGLLASCSDEKSDEAVNAQIPASLNIVNFSYTIDIYEARVCSAASQTCFDREYALESTLLPAK